MTTPSVQWSQALGLSVPIVCAPMGGVAGGALATAVSAAGALGMIGMGSSGASDRLEEQLAHVPDGRRVGIGMVDWVMRRDPRMLEIALAARPVLLSVSFGDATSLSTFDWVPAARDAGVVTAVQAADVMEARHAADAGIDVVVARGREGGGHGRPLNDRDRLLDEILAAVDVPVLAAGAVSSADDVRAVLARGAVAAWIGTAFAACDEALSSPGTRAALIAGRSDRTVLTSAFDAAAGHDWPADVPERVLANRFTDRWRTRDDVTASAGAAADFLDAAADRDDPEAICVNAGLGVDRLTRVRSAAEVVADLDPGLRSPAEETQTTAPTGPPE